MNEKKDLEGQVAIVTGGSEGIGFGISSKLAREGAKVYLGARRLEVLEQARDKIRQQGGKAEARVIDILKIDDVKKLVEEVYKENGRLDIFVNNAGAWRGQGIDAPFEEIWGLVEFNMRAPFEIAHFLVQRFRNEKKNPLKILTVASQASLQVMDFGLGYGTAKMGLAAALHHLDRELRNGRVSHIQLYNLYPNIVATEKMTPSIRAGQVQNPVRLDEVVETAYNLLTGRTPTRDARIGYYPGKGIVRTDLHSNPDSFYNPLVSNEAVLDSAFTPDEIE